MSDTKQPENTPKTPHNDAKTDAPSTSKVGVCAVCGTCHAIERKCAVCGIRSLIGDPRMLTDYQHRLAVHNIRRMEAHAAKQKQDADAAKLKEVKDESQSKDA